MKFGIIKSNMVIFIRIFNGILIVNILNWGVVLVKKFNFIFVKNKVIIMGVDIWKVSIKVLFNVWMRNLVILLLVSCMKKVLDKGI